jgi:1-acyl-sn-glycerol-3-phosphate acyltransferase
MEKDAFMALLEERIESRSIALLDLDNPGALIPADIGQIEENAVARAKRLAREAEEV